MYRVACFVPGSRSFSHLAQDSLSNANAPPFHSLPPPLPPLLCPVNLHVILHARAMLGRLLGMSLGLLLQPLQRRLPSLVRRHPVRFDGLLAGRGKLRLPVAFAVLLLL